MFLIRDRIVLGMSMLRFISGTIELLAAFLMIKYNSKEVAFQINSILALVGPIIMISVTSLGLIGLAGRFSFLQMLVIITGVSLIFLGMKL